MTTSREGHQDIRIGTMAGKSERTPEYIRQIAPLGFECFQINFFREAPTKAALKKMAKEVKAILDTQGHGQVVSSLGMFGNPLDEKEHIKGWEACIDTAEDFGCDLVCGFAGGVVGKSVPDSIPQYKKVFSKLAKRAADKGVKIAFENCPMGSTWHSAKMNIAYCPDAWNLMFDALPAENIGLEWEPCHQMCQLIDPMPQLWEWALKGKIFHIHGKDASVHWDLVKKEGINCGKKFAWHRTPGFGDCDWTDIISVLRQHGYRGFIDIEGWHDPVYRGDLEMTGQVHSLAYLKRCRGSAYVPNPEGF